jgi:hypothetical protein
MGIAIAAVMAGGVFYSCGAPAAPPTADGDMNRPAVTVAGKVVTYKTITDIMDRARQQGMTGAQMESGNLSALMNSLVETNAVRVLAEKAGVAVTDEAIRTAVLTSFDQRVEQERQSLIMQGLLKPDADAKALDAVIKQRIGSSVTELREQNVKDLATVLAAPDRREYVLMEYIRPMYTQAVAAKLQVTETELKAAYDAFTIKRILLRADGDRDLMPDAERIVGEIRGGLKFEDAMNRYSKDLPAPGKRVSENTIEVVASQLNEEPYEVLKGKKIGDVAGPVQTPEGVQIFYITGSKSNLPKDFAQKQAQYRKEFADRRATEEVNREVDEIVKSDQVKWNSSALHAAYLVGQTNTLPFGAEREKKLAEAEVLAEKARATDDPLEKSFGTLALFAANTALYNSTMEGREKLIDKRIVALEAVLENAEDLALRMELVDLAVQQKNAERASENLLKAAQFNNDLSEMGQGQYTQIQGKKAELEKAKLLDPDQARLIDGELGRWRREKAEFEKQRANAEKAQREAEAAEKAKAKTETKDAPKTDAAPK